MRLEPEGVELSLAKEPDGLAAVWVLRLEVHSLVVAEPAPGESLARGRFQGDALVPRHARPEPLKCGRPGIAFVPPKTTRPLAAARRRGTRPDSRWVPAAWARRVTARRNESAGNPRWLDPTRGYESGDRPPHYVRGTLHGTMLHPYAPRSVAPKCAWQAATIWLRIPSASWPVSVPVRDRRVMEKRMLFFPVPTRWGSRYVSL